MLLLYLHVNTVFENCVQYKYCRAVTLCIFTNLTKAMACVVTHPKVNVTKYVCSYLCRQERCYRNASSYIIVVVIAPKY